MKSVSIARIAIAAYTVGGLVIWLLVSSGCSEKTSHPTTTENTSGSDAAVPTREFLIEGMSCQGCVDHITSALVQIPGVASAKVSLEEKKAVVAADESQAPTEKILAAITEAGYEAHMAPAGKRGPPAAAESSSNLRAATEGAIAVQPIGIVHSPYKEAKGTPIQGVFDKAAEAWIELKPEYEMGLKDLEGFSHAILLYQFHLSSKVEIVGKPYLENEEHGIFAMRSPNRPNHIGLSVVKIKKVEGNKLHFAEVDVLDGTPVLDIKPYVKQFDCRSDAVSGWVERHYQDGKKPANTTAK